MSCKHIIRTQPQNLINIGRFAKCYNVPKPYTHVDADARRSNICETQSLAEDLLNIVVYAEE